MSCPDSQTHRKSKEGFPAEEVYRDSQSVFFCLRGRP